MSQIHALWYAVLENDIRRVRYYLARDQDQPLPDRVYEHEIDVESIEREIAWLVIDHGLTCYIEPIPDCVPVFMLQRKNARAAAVLLLGLLRFRKVPVLSAIGRDGVRMLAQYTWRTRNDAQWAEEKKDTRTHVKELVVICTCLMLSTLLMLRLMIH